MSDQWVSELEVNNESIGLLVLGIARECHDLALSRGIPSHSVEDQLPLVFSVFDSNLRDLLRFREIPAAGTPCLAAIAMTFSPEGYRRAASAAKDRMANSVDGYGGGVSV